MSKLNPFISFFLVALFIGCTTEPPRDILTRTVVYEPTEKWMWLHGDKNASEEDLKARFTKLAQYGVTGVLIGGDHEPMFRAAKAAEKPTQGRHDTTTRSPHFRLGHLH